MFFSYISSVPRLHLSCATAVGALIVSLGGGSALVFALSSWLGKVWASRILEKDRLRYGAELEAVKSKYHEEVESQLHRLRDQLERGQFVHRLQFETEFKVYLELWKRVVAARNAARSLRPIAEYVQPGKSDDEIAHDKISELKEKFEAFQDVRVDHMPFYATSVFDAAKALSDLIYSEYVAYDVGRSEKTHKGFYSRDYWDEAIANAEKIEKLSNEVAVAIRKRIDEMLVIPE